MNFAAFICRLFEHLPTRDCLDHNLRYPWRDLQPGENPAALWLETKVGILSGEVRYRTRICTRCCRVLDRDGKPTP